MRIPNSLAVMIAAALSAPAAASTQQAWEEFRATVEETCQNAAEGLLEAPEIVVDPFGSESYGIAVLTGRDVGGDGDLLNVVCVVDKTTGAAELSGSLNLSTTSPPSD